VVDERCALEAVEGDGAAAAVAWADRAAAAAHASTVTALTAVEGAAGPLLVSAGLDGVVKVWR
jgi:hypothetical protein